MQLSEALAWLDSHLNREAVAGSFDGLSTEPMAALVALLGDPQRAYPVIHLTGTNGKGSVARMTDALLVEHGLSVGCYTSPHLHDLSERISRNGEPIDPDALAATLTDLARVEPLLDVTPSWFELVTAAAFAWFAEVAVDVAVVEVGLLGRFDATNVVDADVAVITNIGRDHTDGQGEWRQAIAAEKAGIITPGGHLVLGETDLALRPVFEAEGAATTWARDVDFGVSADRHAVGGHLVDLWTPSGRLDEVFLPAHGAHQVDNLAVAVAATEAFFGRALDADVVNAALAALALPGRFEVVGRAPLVVLDGAHNPPGAAAAARTLVDEFHTDGRRLLVLGMLDDRDPHLFLEALAPASFDAVVTCTAPSPRAWSAVELAAAVRAHGLPVEAVDDVAEAVRRAVAAAGDDDLVFVTGSTYVVGAAGEAARAATADPSPPAAAPPSDP